MKFLKNKIVSIPVGIILFIILLGISPKLAGILVIFESLGLGVYLYTKSEKFKSWNKGVKGLITAGLAFVLLIGIGFFNVNPQTAEQQKLTAEKGKIEQQQKDQAVKKTEETKKVEDTKKAEEAKKQATQQEKSNALSKFNLKEVTVSRVVDGDTVELSDGSKVRFIGVNTPESTTKIEPYGKEASDYTKSKLTGKMVYIEKDVSEKDKYSRLLRYVWLDIPREITDAEIRAKMFNANLLLNGYAEQSTYPPDVKYAEYFKQYNSEARSASKGLWAINSNGTTKGDTDKIGPSGSSGSNSSTGSNSGGSVGQSSGSSTNLGTVYFTPNGNSYHSTPACKTLSRSKTILHGSVQDAINGGHGDPCDICAH